MFFFLFFLVSGQKSLKDGSWEHASNKERLSVNLLATSIASDELFYGRITCVTAQFYKQ